MPRIAGSALNKMIARKTSEPPSQLGHQFLVSQSLAQTAPSFATFANRVVDRADHGLRKFCKLLVLGEQSVNLVYLAKILERRAAVEEHPANEGRETPEEAL